MLITHSCSKGMHTVISWLDGEPYLSSLFHKTFSSLLVNWLYLSLDVWGPQKWQCEHYYCISLRHFCSVLVSLRIWDSGMELFHQFHASRYVVNAIDMRLSEKSLVISKIFLNAEHHPKLSILFQKFYLTNVRDFQWERIKILSVKFHSHSFPFYKLLISSIMSLVQSYSTCLKLQMRKN